ncbi:unnamed protein product [Leuciscus chuanchicus]
MPSSALCGQSREGILIGNLHCEPRHWQLPDRFMPNVLGEHVPHLTSAFALANNCSKDNGQPLMSPTSTQAHTSSPTLLEKDPFSKVDPALAYLHQTDDFMANLHACLIKPFTETTTTCSADVSPKPTRKDKDKSNGANYERNLQFLQCFT